MFSSDGRHEREAALSRWVYLAIVAGVVGTFLLLFPFDLDPLPNLVTEAIYFVLVAAIAFLVRGTEVRTLELGVAVFLTGRLVDFADELVVEPEPIVEPYLSGGLTVLGLAVVVNGTYRLIQKRDERIERLEAQADELRMKDTAIDVAPVGITIADMERPEEPLIYVNQGFERMTGYAVEEALGDNCRFLQGEETDEQRVATLRSAIEAGESAQVTLRNYRKDGTPFWNEVTIAPVSMDGGSGDDGPHYYVGFQQDVTDRVRYQERLKDQRDQLRVLNRILRHDIGNNLQVVLGRLDLLDDWTGDDAVDAIETARQNIDEAISLTQTAQELARATLEGDSETRDVALAPALEGQIADARASFAGASITVDGSIPDVTVDADGMLDSVFRNLLENAVRHNDKAAPEVTVSVGTTTDETVEVRIADNGPGVPDERKSDLFDYGEKGPESTGSGMGTYLIDTLVTGYGGDVWIEDGDPEGAVFVVSLPTSENAASTATVQ